MHLSFYLSLDYGIVWAFKATGPASVWLEGFACVLGLAPGDGKANRQVHFEVMPREPGKFFGPRLLRYVRGLPGREWKVREYRDLVFFEHPAIWETICEIAPVADRQPQVHQMRGALLPAYIDALLAGGLPIHGALVEIDGIGVILAGRSGEGKSTACRRLPPHWRVLGDDLCLVVRDLFGQYRVHPLPTWSAFGENGGSGVCRSGSSVPLRAVFFLEQSIGDECFVLKKSTAAISLAASALQVFRSIDFGFPRGEEASVKKALYASASSLAMVAPSHLLRVSLQGRFWEQIGDVLEQGEKRIEWEERGQALFPPQNLQ
jgi:SynChlorMet cassette protein ScmC